MFKRSLGLMALLLIAAASARAVTIDELIAKNIKARGGLEKIRAVQSLRTGGKLFNGDGEYAIEIAFVQMIQRPGLIRQEYSMQGLTSVSAYDGSVGWQIQPFEGRLEPDQMSADDAKSLKLLADLDGPLVDYAAKGSRVEYLGTEDVDGTEAHKLKVTLKDGDVLTIYLDPDDFLEIRETARIKVRGVEFESEQDFGNYQEVHGLMLPFSIEAGAKGQPKSSKMTIEKAEINVALDPKLFRFSATPAAKTVAPAAFLPSAASGRAAQTPKPGPVPAAPARFDAGTISGLGARNIGSARMSGRIASIAATTVDGKTLIYVGSASGGVWKSDDGGTTFKPVFDKNPVQSIGAVAIDPSDPKTVWVGTGEPWTRNSVSVGDGIYKTSDGGETWTNMGLAASERISQIVIHPKDGNVVYACVAGKLWSDSAERGLYKTVDGGRTWTLILRGPNLSTGCASLAMDPQDPETLIAGLWDFRRQGWTFRSGGDGPESVSGSGLFRSEDGGQSWTTLEPGKNGLPAKPYGRIEVRFAPSNDKIVYAFIEGVDSALYRSDDGGQTWVQGDKSQNMVWRPFYFARLVVDPTDPDRVFKAGGGLIVSEDGGKSFSSASGGGHGDWHDVWIDPANPKHVIGGDDGGLWISYDGASRWWMVQNLPISQFYHVSLDDRDPFQVYGGLQDNGNWVADSEYPGGITNSRWESIPGGDGFWVFSDPADPDFIYSESQGGYIIRYDRKTHEARDIQPKPGYREKLRFNWNTPVHLSPNEKGTIYIGAQFLFRSRDHGQSWDRISPDLTTNDPEKQKQEHSGGITVDNSSAETHTTIYSISESPKNGQVIWIGTDDGNVQLTRDGGASWQNLTANIKDLPKASWVSWVEASRFDPATAFAAFDRHTFGDLTPYIYKTADWGQTWVRIAGPEQGLRGYAHVIKEDTVRPDLLFAGTEFGLWISPDGGKQWAAFKGGNFPSVAVRDIVVDPRTSDLVLATHGRGIWIVDDISPLRSLTEDVLQKEAAFLPSRPIVQRIPGSGGYIEGDAAFTGPNPPGGAVITYYQRTRHLFGPIKIEILGPDGKVVDTIPASKRRGLNRVTWAMRVAPPRVPKAAVVASSGFLGPRVLPGTYTLRLTKGQGVYETKLEIGLDPRVRFTEADRKAQFDAAMRVHGLFNVMSALVDRITFVRARADESAGRLPETDALRQQLAAFSTEADGLRKKIVATKEGGAITGEERLREHMDSLYGAILSYEGRPAQYQLESIDALQRELDDVSKEFDAFTAKALPKINEGLKAKKMPTIGLPPSGGPPTERR